jgi:hypothetical protein
MQTVNFTADYLEQAVIEERGITHAGNLQTLQSFSIIW